MIEGAASGILILLQERRRNLMERKLQFNNEASDNEDINKQFHPAFCDAMTQIFEHDNVKYVYEREYNLNSMPNRIDLLVIRIDDKKVVSNNKYGCDDGTEHDKEQSVNGIAKLCRTYNIFEYKSPRQQLSVDEYYVAMAYAYLYAGKTKNAKMEDITVSFVREGKPHKLMSYFKKNGHQVTEYEKGIYHIIKKDHVDMQIIVTGELDDKYIWLRALSDKLTLDDAVKLAIDAGKEHDSEGRQRVRSILDLVSRLNRNKEWMKEMKSMGAFRDLFKEEFEEKDKKIQDLSEQLQSQNEQLKSKDEQLQSKDEQLQNKDEQLQNKDEQLQSKDEQLQRKDKEVKSLKEEIEHLKEQMRNNKIAML